MICREWTAGALAWYDGFQWHPVISMSHFPNLGNSILCGFFDKGIVLSVKENYYIVTRKGDGHAISFIVPPPFIQRWYFYIPATGTGIVILGLGLLLFQRRRKYVRELEAIRFDQRFESMIDIGPEVDGTALIPSMLVQPYVENAIRHGLVHKGTGGKLSVTLHRSDHTLSCTIEDNGIGRGKAEEIRDRQGRNNTGMGMQITKDQLDILNAGHQSRTSVFITDLFDANGLAAGTRVEISIPVRDSW